MTGDASVDTKQYQMNLEPRILFDPKAYFQQSHYQEWITDSYESTIH